MPPGELCLPPDAIITGWDFSTSGVKCLAFTLEGEVVARWSCTTDLWYGHPEVDGLRELNLMQLEGQARASVRGIAARLRDAGKLQHWVAGGISATHHTAGRIDEQRCPIRRAICWNDSTLAKYHALGLERLRGEKEVEKLIGGPWAIRYSLSHLVKDEMQEKCLSEEDWRRTWRILPHGPLAAGYLTGNFDVTSVSSAASTGIMSFRTRQWQPAMLKAIRKAAYRELAERQLPRIVDQFEPLGRLAPHVALETGIDPAATPTVYPTSDDQQAGLVGGGAVRHGQLAVVLGTSAVVNSSSDRPPQSGSLDVMCLNWGPYLWMRCYSNGAGLINAVFEKPSFKRLEKLASAVSPGAGGVRVQPFVDPEPSLGIRRGRVKWGRDQKDGKVQWSAPEPADDGAKFRACLEALAYLIGLAVEEHVAAGQSISQITVSGGIARSDLMCRILATVLNRPLKRLVSDEGPALGAAVTAFAAAESNCRRRQGGGDFTVADAVERMVQFQKALVNPHPPWIEFYQSELRKFAKFVGR